MNGIAEWQSTHRNLSPLDLKFRELAKDSPELLDRAQFPALNESKKLLRYPLQPWPTFVGPEKLAELKRVSVGVSRLLRSVPERIFRNDPEKVAAFYSLGSPEIAELVLTPPTGAETMLSRGDLIETASGFKCIEFNFTANLGGWDTTIITGLQLSVPATARFLKTEGLRATFTDPMFEMLRRIIEDVRRKGILRNDEITVAFLVHSQDIPRIGAGRDYLNREVQRTIDTLGLGLRGRALVCAPESLVRKGAGLFLEGQKVDVAVELYNTWTPPHIYRAFKGDFIGLYNGPMGPITSNKRNVALLSQHAASGVYSAEERAFIEAHIPWTRLVVPGEVDYEGKMHSLVELLTAHQEQFVLKDGDSCGGSGVVLGKCVSPEDWRRTLDRALAEKDWVVQEVLESLPYLYQGGDYGCSVHDMIWGPFVCGDRYGGVVLRMQPKAAGGAVNLSLSATEGIVLEV